VNTSQFDAKPNEVDHWTPESHSSEHGYAGGTMCVFCGLAKEHKIHQ
jgi:hypothetical protein